MCHDLLPHCGFANATPRFICPGIAGNSPNPKKALRQLIAASLPTGHFPYGSDVLYKTFSQHDLSQYVFLDYRHGLINPQTQHVKGAVFVGAKDAIVVLANLSDKPQHFRWRVTEIAPKSEMPAFWALEDGCVRKVLRQIHGCQRPETLQPHGYLLRRIS